MNNKYSISNDNDGQLGCVDTLTKAYKLAKEISLLTRNKDELIYIAEITEKTRDINITSYKNGEQL